MFELSFAFLANLSASSAVHLYWYYFLFEFPRFILSALAVAVASVLRERPDSPKDLLVSVLIVGLNDKAGLARTLQSLKSQTHKNLEIIVVQDGPGTTMYQLGKEFEASGDIQKYIKTEIRGGKAAALNIGFTRCSSEYVVVADIDTSFDRNAISTIIGRLLSDKKIGGVSGNLAPRNLASGFWPSVQAIEYLNNITIGRQFQSMFGILTIVSGAFGAFRASAIRSVGGWDVGPGDDSNLTTKIRLSGWKIQFEPDAWALTDVPDSFLALWTQRLRWNRSLIRNRWRKFRSVFNPFLHNFSLVEVVAATNQLWFNFIATFAYLFYIFYSIITYGEWAIMIILSLHIIMFVFDVLLFLQAATLHPRGYFWKLVLYLPAYALYGGFLMRANRVYAYLSELLFRSSYNDSFYPTKVRQQQEKF
ncbi:N-acetylglucosaminyltransferase [Roseobacter sp. AzwK-3b]|uniref:glycosyltransferase family 2 protein n=1 Tax=Roseobacter sp. AzwK-3b TaxID=351016 RepID=UPI00015691E6|nr:glycosyltransferase [Roseobacter sp. AzwK-3b]EDM72291.1 N-acetylglucosaminyltransferase [Roseobacter sp. AzwK-3b]